MPDFDKLYSHGVISIHFYKNGMKGENAMKHILILFGLLNLVACPSNLYRKTPDAELKGYIDVRWVENDYFFFVPNKEKPFRLIRTDGKTIQPGLMYTDGGSIPRILWGVKGLSPWGHAPAYIAHDWLFEAKHCGYPPYDGYSFQDSVDVLAEALKAAMESNPKTRNYFIFDSIVTAVSSPIAKNLWENGKCNPPLIDADKIRQMYLRGEELPGQLITTVGYE